MSYTLTQRVVFRQEHGAQLGLLLLDLLLQNLTRISFAARFLKLLCKELIEAVPEEQFESLAREVAVFLSLDPLLVLSEEPLLPQLLKKVNGVHESLVA